MSNSVQSDIKEPPYKYWVFISYSREDNLATRGDGSGDHIQWVNWLHEQLETFCIPSGFRDRITRTGEPMPERFFPNFREQEAELPTSGEEIRRAIDASRFLIVIASPRSARSRYVDLEVSRFLELGRGDRIFNLIVDGDPKVFPHGCFCTALIHTLRLDGEVSPSRLLSGESIIVDVRVNDAEPAREMRASEREQPECRALLDFMKLKLIAGLMGEGHDELVRPYHRHAQVAPGTFKRQDNRLLKWVFDARNSVTSGDDAEPSPSFPAHTKKPYLDKNVQFTVFRPPAIEPTKWHSLLAFAHLSEKPPSSSEDDPDPFAEVERQARAVLGEAYDEYRQLADDRHFEVPHEGKITFVPVVEQVTFNPPHVTFLWTEPVHRAEFRLRAAPGTVGSTLRGHLTVFLGHLVLAEIALALRVDERPVPRDARPVVSRAQPYRKIFASYSHRDTAVVEEFERYAMAFGDRYLRDAIHLRAGEVWSEQLRELVREADVFQLFWSSNSMRSPFCRDEWEFALGLNRHNFVRPTYWEDPLPESPADGLPSENLRSLHFQLINFRPSPARSATEPELEPDARQPVLLADAEYPHSGNTLASGCSRIETQESSQSAGFMQRASRSAKKLLPRRPRIQIEYDVELGGAIRKTELPWVTGVMADLSGDNAGTLKDIQDRSFTDVDVENFDAYLKSQTPRVNFAVENLISGEGSIDVDVTFEKLQDFTPDNLVRKAGARIEEIKLTRVMEGRNEFYHISQSGPMSLQLGESCDSLDKLACADYVGMKIGEKAHNLEIYLSPNPKDSSTSVLRIVRKGCLAKLRDARNLLRGLLINVNDKAINSRDIDKILTESPIVEQITNGIESISTDCPEDIRNQIEQIIAKMECRLESQMNLIIHHEKFQKLEGSWRGLHYMVAATETSDMLKIRVINISKPELHRAFKGKSVVGWEQTVIFKKIYEEEYGSPGGRPFGVLIGDYEFGPSGMDVQVLRGMSKVASTAHAPFIASASAELLDLQSWKELNNPRDLRKAIDTINHIAWNSLREDEDSRYIGLAMPRFLSRVPYGANTNPIETFSFEEDVEGNDHTKYCWANAAYAFGANINRSFYENGWTTQIRGLDSGGIVENLPCHVFPADDGGLDAKCPTEIAITDRREKELSDIGLIPLSHYKNTDYCCFFGAQSLKRASQYLEAEATHNEALFCRIPYLFAICRIAHYIKCMVRDKVGSFMEASDMQVWLNKWIACYVIDDGDEMAKAHKPLRYARIEVTDVEGNPGLYRALLYLQPHFQLEGLIAPMRLVTTLIQKG